ncbi:DNA replication/repair protein RecF [Balneolaceae bacterium ANBcel3]|nr:DNA replication/repair protein RecF [Balneolaceae bacterium ANBcel3]
MINSRLSLVHFRNHGQTDVEWGRFVNVITGPNGAGKTNLLDGIHYLCMGRSFTSNSDQYVVQEGASGFEVSGNFEGNIRKQFKITCSFSRKNGKKLSVNDSPLDRRADLIGRVPVVLVSPADRKLTGEGPAERRAFMDAMVSQLSPSYLEDLIRYRSVLKQRNKLLSDIRHTTSEFIRLIEPWDLQLLELGTRLIVKRAEVVKALQVFLEKAHQELAGSDLEPVLMYRSFLEDTSSAERVFDQYQKILQETLHKDRERQQTGNGPHRDDLVFFLDRMELRKYGSQGQHRIYALALKLAQLYYFSDTLEDCPVFLLDDVFGDLDPEKTDIVMNMLLNHSGQSFVTAAHADKLTGFSSRKDEKLSWFEVCQGTVKSSG